MDLMFHTATAFDHSLEPWGKKLGEEISHEDMFTDAPNQKTRRYTWYNPQ